MTAVAAGVTERYGDDAYGLLTNVHRTPVFLDSTPVPFEAPTIDDVVRRELALDDGTPAWRAWVTAAAHRHGVPAVT